MVLYNTTRDNTSVKRNCVVLQEAFTISGIIFFVEFNTQSTAEYLTLSNKEFITFAFLIAISYN